MKKIKVKSGELKAVNPSDTYRKTQRDKEKKKNKMDRRHNRELSILKRNPRVIKEELDKLCEIEKTNVLRDGQRRRKQKLQQLWDIAVQSVEAERRARKAELQMEEPFGEEAAAEKEGDEHPLSPGEQRSLTSSDVPRDPRRRAVRPQERFDDEFILKLDQEQRRYYNPALCNAGIFRHPDGSLRGYPPTVRQGAFDMRREYFESLESERRKKEGLSSSSEENSETWSDVSDGEHARERGESREKDAEEEDSNEDDILASIPLPDDLPPGFSPEPPSLPPAPAPGPTQSSPFGVQSPSAASAFVLPTSFAETAGVSPGSNSSPSGHMPSAFPFRPPPPPPFMFPPPPIPFMPRHLQSDASGPQQAPNASPVPPTFPSSLSSPSSLPSSLPPFPSSALPSASPSGSSGPNAEQTGTPSSSSPYSAPPAIWKVNGPQAVREARAAPYTPPETKSALPAAAMAFVPTQLRTKNKPSPVAPRLALQQVSAFSTGLGNAHQNRSKETGTASHGGKPGGVASFLTKKPVSAFGTDPRGNAQDRAGSAPDPSRNLDDLFNDFLREVGEA
ncbi:WW domain binding protein 11 [Toxoplasma gondii TgCatPRC2]|uniref:WW domain binding protein 11 n=3 Tax=Toxoplasma gondii TaxID=5811 RepID=A0A151HP86_TOXGO|nr:WW domain binding protein 11 [Toxoplasma gondii ME49]EPT28441.1 WW domain binding protein 11 [Toxoplasma gondii ME49]KYF46784.1 WW domain binding protein 11 [Toxoplasma gondii ARI]KYK71061.1 WW domain binding protein 11 [Toxoplasma gondii TgCatPRC2]|eukprot:XP_002365737.1 WW domain binding protein 11 [Toxoplasma gondii ME49]